MIVCERCVVLLLLPSSSYLLPFLGALIVLSGVMSHALDSKDKDIAAQVLAVSALCLVRLQKFDDAKRMVQLYSEVVADQNNDRYTLPFTLAQAEMGFVEKKYYDCSFLLLAANRSLVYLSYSYSEVLGHLARAMEVIERVPMLFHVILAANGLATLIHELMILGKEKSAPALLRDADAQLDKYSKQILFLVVRSALPTRASLLMPLVVLLFSSLFCTITHLTLSSWCSIASKDIVDTFGEVSPVDVIAQKSAGSNRLPTQESIAFLSKKLLPYNSNFDSFLQPHQC